MAAGFVFLLLAESVEYMRIEDCSDPLDLSVYGTVFGTRKGRKSEAKGHSDDLCLGLWMRLVLQRHNVQFTTSKFPRLLKTYIRCSAVEIRRIITREYSDGDKAAATLLHLSGHANTKHKAKFGDLWSRNESEC